MLFTKCVSQNATYLNVDHTVQRYMHYMSHSELQSFEAEQPRNLRELDAEDIINRGNRMKSINDQVNRYHTNRLHNVIK